MATSTGTIGLSASAILAHGLSRIAELEAETVSIDERLRDCAPSQVSALMTQRRAADDERAWLSSKIEQYKREAEAETWEASRQSLNAAWAPLAERRAQAVKHVGECVSALVSALNEMIAVHKEQRGLLTAATPMDAIAARNATKIRPQIQAIDFSEQQARLFVATMLRPMMPQGGRFAPSELTTDETSVAFRDHVL